MHLTATNASIWYKHNIPVEIATNLGHDDKISDLRRRA